jgi:hypothetical protein
MAKKKRKKQKQRRYRDYGWLPRALMERIHAELGNAPDAEIAERFSPEAQEWGGFDIPRETIFRWRRDAGIPPYGGAGKGSTFKGRVEDKYPEIANLIGKVPTTRIAERYGVSRACISRAARRLGHKDGRVHDYSEAFDAAIGKPAKKPKNKPTRRKKS